MKKSKKTIQDLNNVQEDLNKIMGLIDSLDEIDENTDIELMPKVIEHQYQTKKLRQSIYSIDEEAEEEEFVSKKEYLKMKPCHMVVVSTISMSVMCIFMLL